MADDKRLDEIRALFDAEGYKLVGPHQVAGQTDTWSAPYQRKNVQTGVAAYGEGGTALDAAEHAWAKFKEERA